MSLTKWLIGATLLFGALLTGGVVLTHHPIAGASTAVTSTIEGVSEGECYALVKTTYSRNALYATDARVISALREGVGRTMTLSTTYYYGGVPGCSLRLQGPGEATVITQANRLSDNPEEAEE